MERILRDLIQQSDEWYRLLLETDGASEAAAMLGLSKNTTRTELLRAKSTGIAKEFSDWVQEHILDHGHRVEIPARAIAEKLIGDDLYQATYTLGKLRASCDGLTMDDVTAFEHKQWNAALAASVARGELPEEHMPQCQQVLMVTGAQQLLFMVSDGTEENCESIYVRPDEKWFARIRAGWKQFDADLANYQHVEVLPPVTAAPVMALPALSIVVNGAITLTDNLAVFGDGLRTFIERIPAKPSTDQEFVDCKEACKKLQEAQDALDAGEAHALGQISSFDQMRRTKALLFDLARSTRLAVEKLVTAREQQIKVEIRQAANDAFALHVVNLNTRIGKPYLSLPIPDFAGAMKSKRTIASLHDACDTLLATSKIAANEVADRIQRNLNGMEMEANDYLFLFSDLAQIITKAEDDFAALVRLRISDHKAGEARKMDAERDRIRLEEQAKAETEARAKVEAEQRAQREQADAKDRQDRADREVEDKRVNAELAAEEARLRADLKARRDRENAERNRLDGIARAEAARRQESLDTDQLIAALYGRIKDDKRYSAIAKACAAYIAKAQKVAA